MSEYQAIEDLPPRQRCRKYSQIARILRAHGYDPQQCNIDGYLDGHGTTWWTGSDGQGPTNYIHSDGRSEFYGAIESECE